MDNSPLVSTQWLAERLSDHRVRVVDIRGHVLPASDPPPHYFNHYEDYLQAHIPGAAFVDWVHEITNPADPRHAQIASAERFQAVMRRIGVDDDTFVVAYDDAGGMFAARLWWGLNYYGHPRVAVLNGGWTAWVAEGRPVSDELPSFAMGTFVARPQPQWYRSGAEILAAIEDHETAPLLIDVRTPAEYHGEASRAKRAGHIPRARNLPRAELTQTDGHLPARETLRAQFAAIGVTEANAAQVIFYCNAGVSASFGLLALRAAGYAGGAVYDGSWKDWGNDETKPVER
ncbi:MAG: sulfurtransferase [Aggregatilineales bacterium]